MTLQASKNFRLLSAPNFQDVVQSVDCSTEDITIKFGSASSLQSAQAAWKWVNQAESNTIIYVADDEACAGDKGRQPFSVQSITYDTAANTALMAATKAHWRDFAEDASIRISGVPAAGNTARDIGKDVSIDIGHDFSQPIYSTTIDGVNLAIACSNCKTQGTLNADITLSLSNGFEASLTTSGNLGATVQVSVTAGGSISSPLSTTIPIATVPLAGFSIADVVDIGPQLTIVADASISGFSASATATVGASASLPDGSGFTLGQGANLQPSIQATGLGLSGEVSLSAQVAPTFTLQLAATFLGEGLVGGLALQAPLLKANFAGQATSAGTAQCGANTGIAEVGVEVDVSAELDVFGGFGGPTDQPHKTSLFNKSTTLWKACMVV
ncbi:hypothetical protein THARTR1_07544 [Trichoderma harzianum]|uniref:Uncharacterized protein n=1 Tax=Trichoderma harzianum TaxID=5544 RepID=A0A2K0U1W8_TRIHA|nr:hypothetical protein THARTR1_07544 [Trichoderma harzianum]